MLSHVRRFAGDALSNARIDALGAVNTLINAGLDRGIIPRKKQAAAAQPAAVQPAAVQQTPELQQSQASQMDARDARQMEPDGLEDELRRRAFERNARTAALMGAGALGYVGLDALMTPDGPAYDDANRA